LRGGAQEPLTRQDVADKFALNAQHGGWDKARIDATFEAAGNALQWSHRSCIAGAPDYLHAPRKRGIQ